MAYGCLKHNKETPDPPKDCKDCPDFAKKHFSYPDFIQGIDGGGVPNCIYHKVKWKPQKM